MPEVAPDFPRAWVEFDDPGDKTQRFKCDLTWLASRWSCIFGAGCQGIYADRPDDGCCTLGAHFSDKADEKRTKQFVKLLGPDDWQFYDVGSPQERLDRDRRGRRAQDRRARGRLHLPEPARASTAARAARCTAGRSATATTRSRPSPTSAGSCRSAGLFREVERGDKTSYTEVTITEYDRRGWGEGGHDLDWYCSGNTEAHGAHRAGLRLERTRAVELMGQAAYDILRRALRGVRAAPVQPTAATPGERARTIAVKQAGSARNLTPPTTWSDTASGPQ